MPDTLLSAGVLGVLLATGLGTGLLSGLLGIGGGVVIVPVLLELGTSPGLAIGTSHAAVLLASLSAAWAHARAGRIDMALLRSWLPPMLAGAVAGLVAARLLPPELLVAVFAAVAALLGLALLGGPRVVLAREVPTGAAGALPPFLVGMLAAALGIGGGTLGGPALALLYRPLGAVVGAGAAFNIAVAVPSTIAFLAAGQVDGVALAALTAPALLGAPLGARLAPRLPTGLLRRIFAFCLLAIAVRLAL